jgi:hypothetical protein
MFSRLLSNVMEKKHYRDILIERRDLTAESDDFWEKLTLAQKFSASSLKKYGYEPAFIRNYDAGCYAVMIQNGDFATVSADGDIDTNADIHIRK